MKSRIPAATLALVLQLAACRSARQPPAASTPEPTPAPAAKRETPSPAPPAAELVPPPPSSPVPAAPRAYLEILKLEQSGASQEALLQKVRADNCRYQLTTPEILELRQAGVSEAVVEAMLRSGR